MASSTSTCRRTCALKGESVCWSRPLEGQLASMNRRTPQRYIRTRTRSSQEKSECKQAGGRTAGGVLPLGSDNGNKGTTEAGVEVSVAEARSIAATAESATSRGGLDGGSDGKRESDIAATGSASPTARLRSGGALLSSSPARAGSLKLEKLSLGTRLMTEHYTLVVFPSKIFLLRRDQGRSERSSLRPISIQTTLTFK